VIQRILIGGEEFGHLTLTHLYVLHVAVFPLLVFILLGLHVLQVFRHGTAASSSLKLTEPPVSYWPYQSVRNIAAFAVSLSVVSVLALVKGAPLDAPADPTLPSTPRPEWYFLFLFELRRYFSGDWEIVATFVIPLIVLVVLLLMPALDRRLSKRLGAAFRMLVVCGGMAGWGTLTYLAVARDWSDPAFLAARASERQLAERARELAKPGSIPPEGAIALLRDDPQTRGPILFADNCAACHRHGDHFRVGDEAADLANFGTESWIRELLDDPGSLRFFGRTKLTRMKKWVEENLRDLGPQERIEINLTAKWLAGQPRGVPKEDDKSEFGKGYEAFNKWCIECHSYEGEGGTNIAGPDFTGYGSPEWIRQMLVAPNSAERYGKKSSMPSFAEKLSERELEMLVGWLTRDQNNPRESSKGVNAEPSGAASRNGDKFPAPTNAPQKNSAAVRDSPQFVGNSPGTRSSL
jgi:ubiquinol-cytochrome c reductase cytochrome b subunit